MGLSLSCSLIAAAPFLPAFFTEWISMTSTITVSLSNPKALAIAGVSSVNQIPLPGSFGMPIFGVDSFPRRTTVSSTCPAPISSCDSVSQRAFSTHPLLTNSTSPVEATLKGTIR
eukprot:CAMPEP_0173388704 /NCGR_PEP_ID=MMETSP1356-20130122/10944_1 /TAXON_ID=77927 ORGANISM="Hemiselmis virescens, Strain PCC157" /NCGR_SAMPLE_ID=MMETSP1356 /ASSEMBLY_ACC=CAM_ASM_000847 /LENGTH=114 /DNA_ID=CAMNT_0014345673 /DNA_START=688 /DNA_END=1032 /DNA_ORIENTATION=-